MMCGMQQLLPRPQATVVKVIGRLKLEAAKLLGRLKPEKAKLLGRLIPEEAKVLGRKKASMGMTTCLGLACRVPRKAPMSEDTYTAPWVLLFFWLLTRGPAVGP